MNIKDLTVNQVEQMTTNEIRNIKFENCKCCESECECDGTVVATCRYRILNAIASR